MIQGGASGSPVFSAETGKVMGIVASGPSDPINSTVCETAYFIAKNLPFYKEKNPADPAQFKPLAELWSEPGVSPIDAWEQL